MKQIHLELINGQSKDFVANVEVVDGGYKFTQQDGTAVTIYERYIKNLSIDADITGVGYSGGMKWGNSRGGIT